jgi:hypothetical protein
MTKRAPNLYNLVHVAFSDVPYTMAEGDGRRLLGWLAFLIAFLVFAGIQQCRKDATEREPAREPTLHVETDPAPWQLLIDDLVQLGDDTVAAPGQAAAAGVAVHSARSHDCAELRHAVTVLEKAAGPRDAVRAQQVANDIGKIRRRVDQLCAIELPRGSP